MQMLHHESTQSADSARVATHTPRRPVVRSHVAHRLCSSERELGAPEAGMEELAPRASRKLEVNRIGFKTASATQPIRGDRKRRRR